MNKFISKLEMSNTNHLPAFSILLSLNSFCFGIDWDFFGEGDSKVFRTGDFQSFQNLKACDSFIGPATARISNLGLNDLTCSLYVNILNCAVNLSYVNYLNKLMYSLYCNNYNLYCWEYC